MSSPVLYPQPIEDAIARIEAVLSRDDLGLAQNAQMSQRSLALLLLQRDPTLWQQLQAHEPQAAVITTAIEQAQMELTEPLTTAIARARQSIAWNLEEMVLSQSYRPKLPLAERIHQLTVNPLTGFPILAIVLYFGVYKFVGEFGAGTLVDAIETFFEGNINPVVNQVVETVIPWGILQDLVAHDYGIITLGFRYAIAIVLPVVATYFFMFSLLEDSGYLPRLSLMLDRLFKLLGLSGRSVIPMVLGLGCVTMATMVTRTLETRRERILATFLLSLAVPCAAQWGVMVGLLSQQPAALLMWVGFISAIFMIVGYFTDKILPGKAADFYMEIPPLRLPRIQNILKKTFFRMKWYFWEIIPLFIWASVIIWAGRLTGLFDLIISGLQPIVTWLGLPANMATVFLYGFFRRDYGAAGLFDLNQTGSLSTQQLLVAAIILTLFLPCIAQLQVMLKERGGLITLAIVAFIIPFAFLMGGLANVLAGAIL
jgi:ferrous iron transport protein B